MCVLIIQMLSINLSETSKGMTSSNLSAFKLLKNIGDPKTGQFPSDFWSNRMGKNAFVSFYIFLKWQFYFI